MLACGENKATERGIRIKIQGKKTYEMYMHSMLQPGTGSHCTKGKENKERKEWGWGRDDTWGI